MYIQNEENNQHNKYRAICRCGGETPFLSNQKVNTVVDLICKHCHSYIINFTIPSKEGKQRKRNEENARLESDILKVFESLDFAKITVRQIYYQLVMNFDYPKTDKFYQKAQRMVRDLRRDGRLPYELVYDLSRNSLKANSYTSFESAAMLMVRACRLDFLEHKDFHIQFWLEKKTLQDMVFEVLKPYSIKLCVSGGEASDSYVREETQQLNYLGKPKNFIYILTDFDGPGQNIARNISKKIKWFANNDVVITHLGLNEEQIHSLNLKTRLSKNNNSSKKFDSEFSAELEALTPQQLQKIVKDAVRNHISDSELVDFERQQENQRELCVSKISTISIS